MFTLPKDRNGHPVQLFPGERPRAVQRLTTVGVTAVNSTALNINTRLIRVYSADYDSYVYIKDSVFTGVATNSAHHFMVPANTFVDVVLPPKPSEGEQFTLSIIADGTVSKFMIYEI